MTISETLRDRLVPPLIFACAFAFAFAADADAGSGKRQLSWAGKSEGVQTSPTTALQTPEFTATTMVQPQTAARRMTPEFGEYPEPPSGTVPYTPDQQVTSPPAPASAPNVGDRFDTSSLSAITGQSPQAGDTVRVSFFRAPAPATAAYRLRAGDGLNIQVRNQAELSAAPVRVLPDGGLSLPRIGVVQAGGLTLDELQHRLVMEYKALQLRDPEVSVLVQELADPSGDLFTAIGSNQNGSSIDILVPPSGVVSLPALPRFNAFQPLPVWRDAVERAIASAYGPGVMVAVNFANRANDRIYVVGEVNNPGAIDLRDGRDALSAVAAAGGVLRTAARSRVFVVRRGEDGSMAQGYDLGALLDAKPGEAPIELAAGDVLVVPPTRISKINTAVSQYIRGVLPVDFGIGFEIQQ
ncbi:MAG: polysaccharide biosynthesis/export family protein [Pseudomonadota bacterium]